jgi:hypothetical protein
MKQAKRWTKWMSLVAVFGMLWMALPVESEAGYVGSRRHSQRYDPTVRVTHGFRTGALYITNMYTENLKDAGLAVPSVFLIGYELIEKVSVNPYMNILFAQNILIGGFEQSAFFASANAVLGVDFMNTFQIGVGINLSTSANWSHMVTFVSWTPQVGDVLIPLTLSFVPD